jgi:hypothetical protein
MVYVILPMVHILLLIGSENSTVTYAGVKKVGYYLQLWMFLCWEALGSPVVVLLLTQETFCLLL